VTPTRYDPDSHHRRSIRLKGYDYSQAGAYFVTVCAWRRDPMFGHIGQGAMLLNEWDRIVEVVWAGLPSHYPGMEGDAFVVMPNHVHAIVLLTGVAAGFNTAGSAGAGSNPVCSVGTGSDPGCSVGAGFKPAPTVAEIVRALKTFSARRINELRGTPGVPVWQRNYYEHVVRNARVLDRIRSYIAANPANWTLDWENPQRTGLDELEGWLYGSRGL